MKFEVPYCYKNCMGIYSVTNIANGKRIIGQTLDFETRFKNYNIMLNSGKYGNKHLQRAYIQYGPDNFKMELVNLCESENLTTMESYFCNAFNSLNNNCGYNKKDPIEHGKYTDDARARMSASQMGNQNCLGYKRSDDTKKKMSIAKIGHRFSDDTRKKLSVARKNRIITDETKRRLSESHMGHKHSDDTKKKMSETHKLLRQNKELLISKEM